MGVDALETAIIYIKILVIFLMMVQMVPILVWVERRGSAFIQHRLGPNRVGPLGLFQLLADALKFISKEAFTPDRSVKFLYYAAPVIALIPAALALNAIPFSPVAHIEAFEWLGKTWGPYNFAMQGYDAPKGLLFIFGVSSLGAYALLLAGWASTNKYSMMGALRASAQMISYELSLGLSIVGAILVFGSVNLTEIIAAQQGPLSFHWGAATHTFGFLPNWGIFFQPIGAFLFFSAAFAECNRLPFDLPEAEGELVVGFHTEYGGFKMLLFFMGEYGHMMVASSLMTILFFGGWSIPGVTSEMVTQFFASHGYSPTGVSILTAATFLISFVTKVAIFLWIFIWVRWTLPRFRYDRLMDLGWKTMLPWALANTVLTATVMYLASL